MNNRNRLQVVLFLLLSISTLCIFGGCGRPQPGTEEYRDPMLDETPFQPAQEFEYLADIEHYTKSIEQNFMPPETDVEPEGEAVQDTAGEELDLFTEMGIEKENVMAEANERMVHARGTYKLTEIDQEYVGWIAESGSAQINLPMNFPRERWLGHLFIAEPGHLVNIILEELDSSLDTMQSGMEQDMQSFSFGLDFWLASFGIEEREDLYNWMGDEFYIFDLTNPDFDPDAEPSARNTPFYSLMAIEAEKPGDGMDVLEGIMKNPFVAMMGITVERGDFMGNEALVIPAPEMSESMMSEFMTEEQMLKAQKQYQDLPDTVVVDMSGYIVVGEQYSMETALWLFEPGQESTNRKANMEAEWNWDMTMQNFSPDNMGPWMEMLESRELTNLMLKLYQEIKDLDELGTSRMTVNVVDEDSFELDIRTSRSSIDFFKAVQKIIDETPPETWEKIGNEIGRNIGESGGMGGFPGMEMDT